MKFASIFDLMALDMPRAKTFAQKQANFRRATVAIAKLNQQPNRTVIRVIETGQSRFDHECHKKIVQQTYRSLF